MELYEEWYNYIVLNGLPVLYSEFSYAEDTDISSKKKDFIKFKHRDKKSLKFYFNKLLNRSNM